MDWHEISGGVTAPRGFRAAGITAGLKSGQSKVKLTRTFTDGAQDQRATRCVVGNRVLNLDLPIFDARVDDLKARHHAIGGTKHISRRNAGSL